MGYMKHDAIIVTAWDENRLRIAHGWAKELGLSVSEIVDSKMNGQVSFLIAPDGSKEGWAESEKGDAARLMWIQRVRNEEDLWVDWIAVRFGGDDSEQVSITDHVGLNPTAVAQGE